MARKKKKKGRPYGFVGTLLALLFVFLVAACETPRVTTQTERDTATVFLNSSKTALIAFNRAGKFTPAKFELAMSQLDKLQASVDASATTPVSWVRVWSDLSTFAAEWALPPPPEKP